MALFTHPSYDRLLMGSPLRRPGFAVVIGVVLLAVLWFSVEIQLGFLEGMRPDVASVFARALFLSTMLAAVPVTILWFLDRRERETPWLFAAALFWGACIATALSLPANSAFAAAVAGWVKANPQLREILGPDAVVLIVAPLSAPIVEETAKGLGLLAVFWLLRAEFDNMRDGFVYGALVGLGFTWFEAPLYIAQNYAEFGTAPWGLQLGFRYALFGLSGHPLFTGLFGAGLGLAMQTRRGWLKVLAPIFGFVLAVAAHFLNNVLPLVFALAAAARGKAPPQESEAPPDLSFLDAFLSGSLVQLTVFLPFVAILALALWRSGVWERRVIREELAGEVGRAVSTSEYEAILADSMFRTRRIDRLRKRESAALVNAQHELAFRKRRVRDERNDPERDPLVAGWRTEIERLRTR